MTDWDSEDFAAAGAAVDKAFLWYIAKGASVMMAAVIAMVATDLGYMAFAAWALWIAPQWMTGFAVSAIVADVGWIAAGFQNRKKSTRTAEDLPLRRQMRAVRWWFRKLPMAVYIPCTGIVLSHFFGQAAGITLTACYVVLNYGSTIISWRISKGMLAAGSFATGTSRPDTPEI